MIPIKAFNININPLTKSEFVSAARSAVLDRKKVIQIGINSASVNLLFSNPEFKKSVQKAGLVNVDGISVLWALRFLGYEIPERVATPDLVDEILKMSETEGFSLFLFGAKEKSVLLCKSSIEKSFPNIKVVGYRNGYYSETDEPLIVDDINKANPDILLIAMPSPQKELFFSRYGKELNASYILGVGGYFDILAGLVRRAPNCVQKIGMEWFYRFIQEPRRLWRRYLLGNLKFLWTIAMEKYNLNKKILK